MNNFKNVIDKLKQLNLPIYIAGHINPDDDSIGATLSMSFLFKALGLNPFVLLEDEYNYMLINHDIKAKIVNTVKDKKFVFVAMDLNETYRLGNYEDLYLKADYKINIDHHQENATNADYVLSLTERSSTCEIVYKLISLISPNLLKESALCKSLYTGILTDTKCFTKRLSKETLSIAQHLISNGIDYASIIKNAIHRRTMYQFRALARLINDLKKEEKFYYVIIDKTLAEYSLLTHNDIVKILAEEVRKIEGIDLLLILINNGESITAKVASNITGNAHIIAQHFGGGGHKGEAGFTTTMNADEILQELNKFLK